MMLFMTDSRGVRVSKRLWRVLGLLAAALLAGLVWVVWQNRGQQRAMEQRLADLQRQVESATRSGAPLAGQPVVPEISAAPGGGALTQDLSVLEKQRNIRTVMEEGWRLINERNPQAAAQAVEIFREGLEKVDPQNAQFRNGLGRALLIAGRPQDAIETWQQGLATAPQISDMRSGIGWAYWNLRDYYHARQAWEEALKTNPKSLDAWSAMAWIYLALGDAERSRDGFQVLYLADHQNKDWILGLQMAQARNSDPAQISKFFPLPPLTAFTQPAAPVSAPGMESSTRR
jgi:tetratricopeptide (TPR) repeat protein